MWNNCHPVAAKKKEEKGGEEEEEETVEWTTLHTCISLSHLRARHRYKGRDDEGMVCHMHEH